MLTMTGLPKPYKNKVLVEVEDLPERTASGLYLPETAKTKHRSVKGKVVDVGPECKLGLKAGQTIFFQEFTGSRMYIKLEGESSPKDYLFVVEDALLMVIEED